MFPSTVRTVRLYSYGIHETRMIVHHSNKLSMENHTRSDLASFQTFFESFKRESGSASAGGDIFQPRMKI